MSEAEDLVLPAATVDNIRSIIAVARSMTSNIRNINDSMEKYATARARTGGMGVHERMVGVGLTRHGRGGADC